MVEHIPRNQNSDPNNSINRLVEAIAGNLTQQRPQAATTPKQAVTNTLTLDGKENNEIFRHLFHTMFIRKDRSNEN